jgi:hypothetical protein
MGRPARVVGLKNKMATKSPDDRDAMAPRCRFVISGDDAAPGRPRFCDRPALPSSAYCAAHRALCSVPLCSAAGARLLRRLRQEPGRFAEPPEELAYLASVAVAELDSADGPADIAACLDIAPDRDMDHD